MRGCNALRSQKKISYSPQTGFASSFALDPGLMDACGDILQ